MFSTNFKKICRFFAENIGFEKSKTAEKITGKMVVMLLNNLLSKQQFLIKS